MREQLLAGQRIQMGDLGTFSIHINSMGAESLETYNPAIHVEDLNVRWKAGTRFLSLLKDSVFNLVPTRKAAKLVVKALKAGKNTVDLRYLRYLNLVTSLGIIIYPFCQL